MAEAERIAAMLLSALDYVGVIGVELFERDDGYCWSTVRPRVHNTGTGRWTAARWTSRAAHPRDRRLALGDGGADHVEMTNLLGPSRRLGALGAEPETGCGCTARARPAPAQDGPRERLTPLRR